MSSQALLGPGGAVALRLARYETRPQQLAMASGVAQAIAARKHLMVEASTGVGKTFAYLAPALEAALANKDLRIVVSTHTINLQEQLITKDIPFLLSLLPEPIGAILVKGRSNYLSKRRLRVADQRAGNFLFENASLDQLQKINAWSKETREGSRHDLTFRPLPPVWDLVESDSGNCLGRKCSDFESCFYFKARKGIQSAQLFVVNHALFFSDLALRSLGVERSLLPDYQVAIFDEAHNLEDVAADHLGLSITRGHVDYLLRKLLLERRSDQFGILSLHGDDESRAQVYKTRQAVERFFDSLLLWKTSEDQRLKKRGESLRVRQTDIVPDTLSGELKALVAALDRVGAKIPDAEEKIELEAVANRCHDVADKVQTWLGQKLPAQVYWVDGSGDRGQRLSLNSAPIEVGSHLRALVFDRVPTVILTSATLSVGGASGFRHVQERLGFPQGQPTLQLGSPFDYEQQAELHLFRNMPDPSSPAFDEACLEKIQHYLLLSLGRAFVLFTSSATLKKAADRLREWCAEQGLTLLAQSDGLPPAQMLERFRSSAAAVLFGVDSFWQGVDVQGEALATVIITKLPFVPPDRPVVEARAEAIAARGGNSFYDYMVPQAVIKLKQGFGRLIRTKSDQGLVAILDPRILTKAYGRLFLDALPPCRRVIDGTVLV